MVLPVLDCILQYLMNWLQFNEISPHLTKSHCIILDFIHFVCIMLTFAFIFGDEEHFLQNFGLAQTGSKFVNFRLGDGKS